MMESQQIFRFTSACIKCMCCVYCKSDTALLILTLMTLVFLTSINPSPVLMLYHAYSAALSDMVLSESAVADVV